MNDNRIIWYFKEPRSGSSWLSYVLTHKLNRKVIHVDIELFGLNHPTGKTDISKDDLGDLLLSGKLNYNDTSYYYATHRFELLSGLSIYKDPIIIRSIRRNLTELILSEMTLDMTGTRLVHLYKDPIKNAMPALELSNLVKNPVKVVKAELMRYMVKIKNRDQLWDAHANNFENYTIVYEDLAEGVNLPVYEGTIKYGDYDDDIIKTPDYKRDLFSNYDQIVDWVNEIAESMKIVR